MTKLRLGLATILSPWSSPALIIVISMVAARGWPFHYELPWILAVSVVTSFIAIVLLGLPLFFWLRRNQKLTWPRFVAAGAVAGVICFFAFEIMFVLLLNSEFTTESRSLLLSLSWGAILGAVVSGTFSMVAGLPTRQKGRT